MEQDLRDQVERTHQITELTRHPGWALLYDFMVSRTTGKQRWLIDGKADSIEEYKGAAGWIKGVLDVFEAPDVLAEQVRVARESLEEREREREG